MHVLRGNHGQQEDTNEFTDEETKECGTEDDSSRDDESEEDIVLAELLSGHDSDQDKIATSSPNGNVIASMKVKRYGLSFKAIQMKRNFMVLIKFVNS